MKSDYLTFDQIQSIHHADDLLNCEKAFENHEINQLRNTSPISSFQNFSLSYSFGLCWFRSDSVEATAGVRQL